MTSGQSLDSSTDVLVVVDVQNDFLPGGALGVPLGNDILPGLYKFIQQARDHSIPVAATRDWHPTNHVSFKARDGPWPPHCVRETKGAEFPDGFPVYNIGSNLAILKGTTADKDAYSGFDGTDLDVQLKQLNVRRVFVCGIATEYCVLATAQDAHKLGYEVFVLEDLISAVEPERTDEILSVMRQEGINILSTQDAQFL
ncbi:pyrazinamidase/nicotinamidase [Polychytrium aggregatum]|uniref:pyrazinamidase/nicotinamidase n=1 Tax=Polychytrium aggregatum TaxID=110093 RepID=UPI0022FE4AE3|nr:pyrazinamidase/nicotinamidase [Polychytrium aggregatum]KAI9204944.1 pyrazinamidase/nicotinamidase [Polychytrium aggregatum]